MVANQQKMEEVNEVRRQLEKDNPDLIELKIGHSAYGYGYIPDDGDWGALGVAIGRNTHLRELLFDSSEKTILQEDFEKLFRGVACNTSIQKLCFESCRFFGGDIFNMLVPFFKNSNFEFLEIGDGCRLQRGEIQSIASALEVVDSSTMKLILKEVDIESGAFDALAALLQNPKSKLAVLGLRGNATEDEAAAILATGLTGNRTLKKLDLSRNRDITEEGWRTIFTALQSCRLEKLTLGSTAINDTALLSLCQVLTINRHIKTLDLSFCHHITIAGWRILFELLQSPNSALEELHLYSNAFTDEAAVSLTNSLINNHRLRELNLHSNSNDGWGAFSAVLQSPHTALEKLNMRHNAISDVSVISLANSLANNSRLKELLLDGNVLINNGWAAFSHVLCNKSSIMDTYRSNHTLEMLRQLFEERRLPEDVRSLLQINRENTKSQAARLKITRTHFPGGFVAQPFVGMDFNVLPYAIAWMGRDGEGEVDEHFYGYLRSMPSLFDVEGHNTKTEHGKPKRQRVD